MNVSAHCFARGVTIESLPIHFQLDGDDISIDAHNTAGEEGLVLEVLRRNIDVKELARPPQDDDGHYIEKQMRPYKERLLKVAQLMEGYLSIMYIAPPPKFDFDKIVVNVHAQTDEEREKIRTGEFTGGFGNIFKTPQVPVYKWSDKITPSIPKATQHLPALSFLAQALRSQERGDQEIAFFLYFRIIDGYFSDGVSDIEKRLLEKANELQKYILYNDTVKKSAVAILVSLRLTSKCEENFEGLIKDIVLVRHKLTHFSETNSSRHHSASIVFDLNILNRCLQRACVLVLRDRIGI